MLANLETIESHGLNLMGRGMLKNLDFIRIGAARTLSMRHVPFHLYTFGATASSTLPKIVRFDHTLISRSPSDLCFERNDKRFTPASNVLPHLRLFASRWLPGREPPDQRSWREQPVCCALAATTGLTR